MSPPPFRIKAIQSLPLGYPSVAKCQRKPSAPCHIAINRIGKIDDSLLIIIAFKHYGMVASP